MQLRLIDPETGRIIFDSEDHAPEQLDAERDHVVAGPGWQLLSQAQMERERAEADREFLATHTDYHYDPERGVIIGPDQ